MSNQIDDLINKKIRGHMKLTTGLYYRNVVTDDIVKILKVNYVAERLNFRYVTFLKYADGTHPIHFATFPFFLAYFSPYPLLKGTLLDLTKEHYE